MHHLKHLLKTPRYSYERSDPWCGVHPLHTVNDVLLTTCVACLSAFIRERSSQKAAADVDIEMGLAVMRGLSVPYEPEPVKLPKDIGGGTIGDALAAACAKVAAIREEIAEAGFLVKPLQPHHALRVKDTAIVGCTCGLRFTTEDEAVRHQAAVAQILE